MQDLLLSTIETFYDCVDEGFDHKRAIAAFSAATDDTGFLLSEVWPMLGRQKPLAHHNIPDEAVAALVSSGFTSDSHDFFKSFSLIPEQVPVLRRAYMSDADHFQTSVYRQVNAPWGLHSEGVSILKKSWIGGICCGFVRHPGQDEIDHEILAQIAILSKHLTRAMRLQHRLDGLGEAVVRSSNALDLIDFGMMLYDEGQSPVFVNKLAHRVLEEKDGLSLGRHGLVIKDTVARQEFEKLLGAALDQNAPIMARSGGLVRVPRPSRKKPFSLMVVPMLGHSKSGIDNVSIAVLMFDPAIKRTTPLKLFTNSYGLTRAEAVLALELAQGVNIDDFAAKRDISINTARTQLRAIFAKTETSRQHELVSLLLRSVAGVEMK